MGNPLYFRHTVLHGIYADPVASFPLNPLWLGKVDAAGQLADHKQVETAGNHLLFEGRCTGKRRENNGRTQVGIQTEYLAQRQQRPPFRLFVRRQCLPFGAAHRTEQNGIGSPADINGGLGERLPFVVDSGATDIGKGAVEDRIMVLPIRSSTLIASSITSGPIPSPGRTAILNVFAMFHLVESIVPYCMHKFSVNAAQVQKGAVPEAAL